MWKLEIEFRNWKFEELFGERILNKWISEQTNKRNDSNNGNNNDWISNYENWNFGNWKLNLEIGILNIYLKMEFTEIRPWHVREK